MTKILRTKFGVMLGNIFSITVFAIAFARPAYCARHLVSDQVYPLGKVHGVESYCRIVTKRGGIADSDEATMQLSFYSKLTKKPISVTEIESFNDCIDIKTADFMKYGHKQLFISASMGRTVTYLYNFDGKRVHCLYVREDGRVGVTPIWYRRRGVRLKEIWGRLQFLDEANLGTGVDMGRVGVVRYLHWNGKQFVPDRPGDTNIISDGKH